MFIEPFTPKGVATIAVANAITASVAASLDDGCDQVRLYNASATATAYWRCQPLSLSSDAGPTAVIPVAGGATGDMPIAPGERIILSVGLGPKKFSVIASAADSNLFITPGKGM